MITTWKERKQISTSDDDLNGPDLAGFPSE